MENSLKKIGKELVKQRKKVDDLLAAQKEATRVCSLERNKLSALESKYQDELNKTDKRFGANITDHAIMRYLERVKGVNLKEIEKEILSPRITGLITVSKNGRFPHESGAKIVVKDGIIITVEPILKDN